MNEAVKYDNYMNALKFKNFTSIDLDFLMFLCARMKNIGTEEMTFDFSDIKQTINHRINSNERFIEELKRMNMKMLGVTCELKIEKKTSMFVLFPTFETDEETNTLTVAVNKKFSFILNELVKNFTRFELAEFLSLESKYTKNLYRLLKQFKTTGTFIVDNIEDFKERLDSPKSYKVKEFKRFVLDVAVKELQEKEVFKNLVCEPVKARKRGSPVVGYTFTFKPEQIVHRAIEQQEEPKKATKKEPNKSTKSTEPSQKPTPYMTKSAIAYNSYPQRQYSQEFMEDLEAKLLALSIKGE